MNRSKLLYSLLALVFICFNTSVLKSQEPGAGYCLDLDGFNDYVDCGDNSSFQISQGTLECWIKPDVTSTMFAAGIPYDDGSLWNSPYVGIHVGVHSGGGIFWLNVNGINRQFTGGTISTGEWYHIALTYDGSIARGYINGIQVGTSSYTGTIQFSGSPSLVIGQRSVDASGEYFNGQVDEVRLWKTPLPQALIRQWMTRKVTTDHDSISHLVSYYKCDEGSGSTLVDSSGSNNGTLYNSPSFELSGAAVADQSKIAYGVTSSTSIGLKSNKGDSVTLNVTSGTASAISLNFINQKAHTTTPPTGIDQISKEGYFGAKLIGSNSAVYEVVYHYSGHSGISDEDSLRLCSRDDNSDTTWTLESGATLNTTNNTLTLGGQTGTQFVLGSTGVNALPVTLHHFKAEIENAYVQLHWVTTSEYHNHLFTIEASSDGNHYYEIGKLRGAGTSWQQQDYHYLDKIPLKSRELRYYRIIQTDYDGKCSYFGPIQVKGENQTGFDKKKIQLYPNPVNDYVHVSWNEEEYMSPHGAICIYDSYGQLILQSLNHSSNSPIDIECLESGIYYLILNDSYVQTFIKY